MHDLLTIGMPLFHGYPSSLPSNGLMFGAFGAWSFGRSIMEDPACLFPLGYPWRMWNSPIWPKSFKKRCRCVPLNRCFTDWDPTGFVTILLRHLGEYALELFRSYVKFCWRTFQEANVGGETSHIFWNFHTKNLRKSSPIGLAHIFSDGLVKNRRLDHLHLEHTERYFHLTGWLIWRFLTALFFNIGI